MRQSYSQFIQALIVSAASVLFPQHLSIALADTVVVEAPLKVPGAYSFTEGPAYDGEKYVYFTDIPANRIYRLDIERFMKDQTVAPEVFLEDTNAANGLVVDSAGTLIVCQMGGLISRVNVESKKMSTVASTYLGVRFNACNDVVVDRDGGLYFTDPRYAAPDPWPQGVEAVYYRHATGNIVRIADDLTAPNGILLAPDGKTLYVLPSMQRDMIAFDIVAPGSLSDPRVFFQVPVNQDAPDQQTGGDGGTIDSTGRIYITTHRGVDVVSSQGEFLQTIAVPQQPANITFAGKDRNLLVATARTSVYVIPTNAHGIAPLGALAD